MYSRHVLRGPKGFPYPVVHNFFTKGRDVLHCDLAVGRWFPPGTPVSSTRKLISSPFHRLDMTLAVAEALNPNKPNQTTVSVQCGTYKNPWYLSQKTRELYPGGGFQSHIIIIITVSSGRNKGGGRGGPPPQMCKGPWHLCFLERPSGKF